jgi:hypothetical protein
MAWECVHVWHQLCLPAAGCCATHALAKGDAQAAQGALVRAHHQHVSRLVWPYTVEALRQTYTYRVWDCIRCL